MRNRFTYRCSRVTSNSEPGRKSEVGEKYYLYQESLRGGEILMNFLTLKMVILRGKEEQMLDSKELKV